MEILARRLHHHITWQLAYFPSQILCPSLAIIWQIPRIILTHPSTSDEDVELLTQSPSTEPLHDFDIPDRCVCFDSAFYPPWPQRRGTHTKDTDCFYPELLFLSALKHFEWYYCWGLIKTNFFFVCQIKVLLIVFHDINVIYKNGQLWDFIFVTETTLSPLHEAWTDLL